MCLKTVGSSAFKTMLFIIGLVFVSLASGNDNYTGEVHPTGKSGVAWMSTLLDHNEWIRIMNETSLPSTCDSQLRQYVNALREGKLWATKMFDSSGRYSSMFLFGNDLWLGSMNECSEIHLSQFYSEATPFRTKFFVVKINLTLDQEYVPASRTVLIGECLPASCEPEAVVSLVSHSEGPARERAAAMGLSAHFRTLAVRTVPGTYDLFKDTKLLILGGAAIIVAALMLVASLYEGFLERRYRVETKKDLEVSEDDHNQETESANGSQSERKSGEEDNGGGLRREVCGVWSELLLSFSILSNGRTILSTQTPGNGSLNCLHGMRFLSVCWVIMVHTYLSVFYVSDNKIIRNVKERDFFYQPIGNASYCVDTFFFIGGVLVTILFLRSEDKKAANLKKREQNGTIKSDINKNLNGYTNSALSVSVISQQAFSEELENNKKDKKRSFSKADLFKDVNSFFLLLLYRVVRLTPAYAFVIGANLIAVRYMHDRSLYEPAIFDDITCDLYWWRNVLYINNMYPLKEMCMVWSWYMANDTQFYIVGVILLLISVKHPKYSLAILSVVVASSWVTTIYVSVWHQYKARIQEPFEMFDPLYDKPWSRIGPYLVGMVVGWYLHNTKCQVRIPYWLVVVGWPCSLAIIGSLIFGMVEGYFEIWPTAFYVSIGHTAWGVALAWMTVCCCCGYGGLVNSVLSYRGWLPLSRLTYCAYLVHPVIMVWTCFLLDGPYHLQNSMVLISYAGYAVMAFLSSFVISVAFEAPAVRLLKIINGGCRKNKSH